MEEKEIFKKKLYDLLFLETRTEELSVERLFEIVEAITDDVINAAKQVIWKPSERQMKALEVAFRKDGTDEYRKVINSLYQDLKKLI